MKHMRVRWKGFVCLQVFKWFSNGCSPKIHLKLLKNSFEQLILRNGWTESSMWGLVGKVSLVFRFSNGFPMAAIQKYDGRPKRIGNTHLSRAMVNSEQGSDDTSKVEHLIHQLALTEWESVQNQPRYCVSKWPPQKYLSFQMKELEAQSCNNDLVVRVWSYSEISCNL